MTKRKGPEAPPAPESPARGFGSTAVYESLRRDILHLALAPGTLLDESEIAERFRLSRSPVREALIRLSAEGLVVTLRNRSSIVAPFDIAAVPSYVDAASLMYRLTSRLAALARTAAQMERIEALQRSHLSASQTGNLEALVSLNRDFHMAIAEASGNSFFAQWTRSLLDQGQRILAIYLHDFDVHIPDGTLDQHLALVDAIRRRDADAAELAGARDADILAQQLSQRLHMRRVGDFPLQAAAPGESGAALASVPASRSRRR
jgi:DNA-binding GntR family transcriptional regulator